MQDVMASAFNRSLNYRKIWSTDKQLMWPRHGDPDFVNGTGELECPLSSTAISDKNLYTEGDALHWLYFVPHDPRGLVDLFPTPEDFDASLEALFTGSEMFMESYAQAEGIPNPYYWAG